MKNKPLFTTVWICLLLGMASFTSAQADSNNSDRLHILKLMDQYTKGTFEGDRELLSACFHKDATMNGYLMGKLLMANPQLFIEDMVKNPVKNSGSKYQHEIKHISIQGNVASVILEESGFPGNTRFSNFFHLINDGNGWKIISKTFSSH